MVTAEAMGAETVRGKAKRFRRSGGSRFGRHDYINISSLCINNFLHIHRYAEARVSLN